MALGERFVTRQQGETELKFRKLEPYDRAEILRRDKSRRRDELRAEMKAGGADLPTVIATMREFNAEKPGRMDFIDLFNSDEGKADIFDLAVCDISFATPGVPSWARSADAENLSAAITAMDYKDQNELAAELCGVALSAEPVEEDDSYEDDDPNLTGETATPPQPSLTPSGAR